MPNDELLLPQTISLNKDKLTILCRFAGLSEVFQFPREVEWETVNGYVYQTFRVARPDAFGTLAADKSETNWRCQFRDRAGINIGPGSLTSGEQYTVRFLHTPSYFLVEAGDGNSPSKAEDGPPSNSGKGLVILAKQNSQFEDDAARARLAIGEIRSRTDSKALNPVAIDCAMEELLDIAEETTVVRDVIDSKPKGKRIPPWDLIQCMMADRELGKYVNWESDDDLSLLVRSPKAQEKKRSRSSSPTRQRRASGASQRVRRVLDAEEPELLQFGRVARSEVDSESMNDSCSSRRSCRSRQSLKRQSASPYVSESAIPLPLAKPLADQPSAPPATHTPSHPPNVIEGNIRNAPTPLASVEPIREYPKPNEAGAALREMFAARRIFLGPESALNEDDDAPLVFSVPNNDMEEPTTSIRTLPVSASTRRVECAVTTEPESLPKSAHLPLIVEAVENEPPRVVHNVPLNGDGNHSAHARDSLVSQRRLSAVETPSVAVPPTKESTMPLTAPIALPSPAVEKAHATPPLPVEPSLEMIGTIAEVTESHPTGPELAPECSERSSRNDDVDRGVRGEKPGDVPVKAPEQRLQLPIILRAAELDPSGDNGLKNCEMSDVTPRESTQAGTTTRDDGLGEGLEGALKGIQSDEAFTFRSPCPMAGSEEVFHMAKPREKVNGVPFARPTAERDVRSRQGHMNNRRKRIVP